MHFLLNCQLFIYYFLYLTIYIYHLIYLYVLNINGLFMAENENTNNIKVATTGQYIKDLSFENPKAPEIYTIKNLNPKIAVSIDINSKKLQEELYEVELIINATASYDSDNKKMFIIELTYAGIFNIKDIEDEEALKEVLFIYCPSLLFPYARRIISDTTRDASMPPLMLDAINFRALYEAKKDTLKKEEK